MPWLHFPIATAWALVSNYVASGKSWIFRLQFYTMGGSGDMLSTLFMSITWTKCHTVL